MLVLAVAGGVLHAAEKPPGIKERFSAAADRMRDDLQLRVFPYWYDTTLDRENGGYLLADSMAGGEVATDKMLVSQARMIWGFSRAHIKGFSDPQRNYLEAARIGYDFLMEHFKDDENGGFYLTTDLQGNPVNRTKVLYAQSFVIYALIEYYHASADPRATREAMELFRLIQRHAHDGRHNGWFEHFYEDWTRIDRPIAGQYLIEVPGLKSANAHLHWMEALTSLYRHSQDAKVRQALAESIEVNMKYFYPKDPGSSTFHRNPDWSYVELPTSAGLSYGHNVEFAWLMIAAQKELGRKPAWDHFYAHIDHALKYGFDHDLGGVYEKGYSNRPATDRNKIWWVQAEMMAALTDAVQNHAHPQYGTAQQKLVNFIWRYMVNPGDGIWVYSVGPDGALVNGTKASAWKAAYHDVRAMFKFYEAFRLNNPQR